MQKRQLLPILLAIPPIVWIIIDGIVNKSLEEANVKLTNSIQKEDGSSTDTFMKVISFFYAEEVVPIILVLLFCLPLKKIPGIKLTIYTVTSLYIFAVLKMLYAQARPYQIYDVHPKACEQDFGRPSGHAMGGMTVYFCIYWLFIYNYKSTAEKQRQLRLFKIISAVVLFGLVFTIGLSRVYLGVHSFGQVLLGWSYGWLFMIFLIFYFDEKLENMIRTAWCSPAKKRHTLITSLVYLGFLIVTIVIYAAKHTSKHYPEWYTAIVIKCEDEIKGRAKTFYEAQFKETSNIAAAFGIFYGLIFLRETKADRPHYLVWYKEICRFLVYIVISGIILGIFEFAIPESESSVWINFFFLATPPYLLVGFSLIWIVSYVLSRLGLHRANGFLEIELSKKPDTKDQELEMSQDKSEAEAIEP